jgi:hypothetical protein
MLVLSLMDKASSLMGEDYYIRHDYLFGDLQYAEGQLNMSIKHSPIFINYIQRIRIPVSYFSILMISIIGFSFFLLYQTSHPFFDVDSRGFFFRATGEISLKIDDFYWPISLTYRAILSILPPFEVTQMGVTTVNYLCLVLGVLTLKAVAEYLGFNLNIILVIFFMTTPFTFRYAYYAGKEPILFLLMSLSLYLYCVWRRQQSFSTLFFVSLLAAIIFFMGTLARPYFLAHVLAVLLVFFWRDKLIQISLKLYFLAFVAIILSMEVNLIHFAKLFFFNSFGFLFSPNFFRVVNWSWPFEVLVSFAVCFIFITSRFRNKWRRILMLLFVYASPPAIVVYYMNINEISDAYGVFFTRTRFPVYGVIFLLIGSKYMPILITTLVNLRIKKLELN